MIWQGWLRLVKPVDHRHGRVFGQLQQRRFLEGADHDRIDIAAEHPGGVGDGLAVAQLHIRPRQNHGLGTHLARPDIKGHPRPGRGLFENQRHHVAAQRGRVVRCALGATGARTLHRKRLIDDARQGLGRSFVDVEKIGHWPAPGDRLSSARAACPRRAMAWAISSSLRVSGGRMRRVFSAAATVRICAAYPA